MTVRAAPVCATAHHADGTRVAVPPPGSSCECGAGPWRKQKNCETKPICRGESTVQAEKRSQFEAGFGRETNPFSSDRRRTGARACVRRRAVAESLVALVSAAVGERG
jgi:hypothetical protein